MIRGHLQERAGGIATTPHLETAIKQQQGQGQPISEDIREPLEESFGADLSGVRVHTDDQSDELNRSIQSLAFTKGRDIFFKRGAYQPRSLKGQELLAHELTHVIQQGRLVQRKDDDKPKQTLKKSKGGIDISKDVTGEIGIFKFTSQNLEHNDAQDALKGDGTVIITDLNNTTASVSGMVVDSEGIDTISVDNMKRYAGQTKKQTSEEHLKFQGNFKPNRLGFNEFSDGCANRFGTF